MKTNSRISRRVTAAALLLCAAAAVAGPPFQTDDPQPIDFRNYEFYTFSVFDATRIVAGLNAPALELNWGALPNVHLHIILPVAASFPSNNPAFAPAGVGPSAYGLGDIELGIKYRFVQETKTRPMVGTFVMFEMPSGNAARGLGVGSTWYKVPLWVQKSFGPWTTYGGGGETIVKAPGFRSYPFVGWLTQRDIGKKWTLGSEVFYHGAEGIAAVQTKKSTMVDVGGYYKVRDPGFQLLFCFGHSVAGQRENYAYLGLYWTWGKHADPDKPATGAFRGLSSPRGAVGSV
jgi:hypothetical protein